MEKECIFCNIINRKLPSEFLYEDDTVVVFKDIHPHAPIHLLVVPKKHIRSINDLGKDDKTIVSETIDIAKMMAVKTNISRSGYKLLFNVEKGGGQVIFHLHLHLMGGWRR